MSGGSFTIPNDAYSSEMAVLSIPDVFIKQEQNNENNDCMILNENMQQLNIPSTESLQEYQLTADLREELLAATENMLDVGYNQVQHSSGNIKIPVTLPLGYKEELSDKGDNHFVKVMVRDGKHVKTWECGICSKQFGHQYTLMRHLPTHTDERRFQCGVCGKAFRQMSTLSQHRAIHSSERPYVCEVCHKTFNRVSTLISHRKTHNGLKPHQCHICSKAFHQKGNLRNHIFTHTNERPYKCDVCQKGFNQMSNLMCHKLKAHQRTDKPRYICNVCGEDFPKRMALRNHEQYHHGIPLNPSQKMKPMPRPPMFLPEQGSVPQPIGQQQLGGAVKDPQQNIYFHGVVVAPIQTEAMQKALRKGEQPYALLCPVDGVKVLVRVLSYGENEQILVPATVEDMRRDGQQQALKSNDNTSEEDKKIEIRIPVVANVYQRYNVDGSAMYTVQNPANEENAFNNEYVITTQASNAEEIQIENSISQNSSESNISAEIEKINTDQVIKDEDISSKIEFIDSEGNVINGQDYQTIASQINALGGCIFNENGYSTIISQINNDVVNLTGTEFSSDINAQIENNYSDHEYAALMPQISAENNGFVEQDFSAVISQVNSENNHFSGQEYGSSLPQIDSEDNEYSEQKYSTIDSESFSGQEYSPSLPQIDSDNFSSQDFSPSLPQIDSDNSNFSTQDFPLTTKGDTVTLSEHNATKSPQASIQNNHVYGSEEEYYTKIIDFNTGTYNDGFLKDVIELSNDSTEILNSLNDESQDSNDTNVLNKNLNNLYKYYNGNSDVYQVLNNDQSVVEQKSNIDTVFNGSNNTTNDTLRLFGNNSDGVLYDSGLPFL